MSRFLVLFVVIVAALNVMFWVGNKQVAQVRNGCDIYHSKYFNLSFKCPPGTVFAEKKWGDSPDQDKKRISGKYVDLFEVNRKTGGFTLVGDDFKVLSTNQLNFEFINMVVGDVNNPGSLGLTFGTDKLKRVVKRGEGIYQVTGYDSVECSPEVTSYLVVKPPQGSGIYSVTTWVGNASEFKSEDIPDVCTPTEKVIWEKINEIADRKNSEIEARTIEAVEIAKSFKTK